MTTTKPTLPDVLRALADGKIVKFLDGTVWCKFENISYIRLTDFHRYDWRIIEPCPIPPPGTIPLGPEDVPPGSVFRHLHWDKPCHRTYYEVDFLGVHWTKDTHCHWQDLREFWLIKRPGEEWVKCEKAKV